jgi:hypothetical protein
MKGLLEDLLSSVLPPQKLLLQDKFWKDPVDVAAVDMLDLLPNVIRSVLAIVFVGSFLLRPLVMRPVSVIWARIIESDKPVFTVIFGGAAAFATAISEAAKHLSG